VFAHVDLMMAFHLLFATNSSDKRNEETGFRYWDVTFKVTVIMGLEKLNCPLAAALEGVAVGCRTGKGIINLHTPSQASCTFSPRRS
jgi:hypothetical protein